MDLFCLFKLSSVKWNRPNPKGWRNNEICLIYFASLVYNSPTTYNALGGRISN